MISVTLTGPDKVRSIVQIDDDSSGLEDFARANAASEL
jgi:hypothetical protein